MIKGYFSKMRGGTKSAGVGLSKVFWSWPGSATGIGIYVDLSSIYLEPEDLTFLIGSFGASAVLVYGAIKIPLR